MFKKVIISFFIVALILIASTVYLLVQKSNPPEVFKDEEKNTIVSVQVEEVTYEDYSESFSYYGRVNSSQVVHLVSEVTGIIKNADIPLEEGQLFKKGQLLINISSDEREMELKAMKSELISTFSYMMLNLNHAFPDEYSKWQKFFKKISVEKPLPPLPKVINSEETTYLANQGFLSNYYNIKAQEINLDKHKMSAPFNGAYILVEREIGSTVYPGLELASIICTDALEIEVEIKPEDIEWISTGGTVSVYTTGSTAGIPGTVDRISPFVSPTSQMMKMFVSIDPSSESSLVTGQYVEVKIPSLVVEQVMEIPREAIVQDFMVYTVENNQLEMFFAEIVRQNEDTALIRGPEEGSLLVIESVVDAESGMPVNVIGYD
ncbi:MAG: HlyD family efflux transporter periplasmic adaptor subunit [Desulfobacterales bacterium]|nr:HlyD family efflux transporter periplasmic adaptor subunit [Desulfobacterales bacterium]